MVRFAGEAEQTILLCLRWRGEKTEGYFITDACIDCGSCAAVCPQSCCIADSVPNVIVQEQCLHCGNCFKACPIGTVERR